MMLPGDELATRVLGNQVVVDRGGREEQQVDDRVPEEPEDVLGSKHVDPEAGNGCLDDEEDEQDSERQSSR